MASVMSTFWLLAAVAPPPLAAQPSAAGTLTGTITSGETGRPVPGAVVVVEGTGREAVANAVGRYVIYGVPPGTVSVAARAPGFLEGRATDVLVAPGATASVTLGLTPSPSFLERIQVTATRTPVPVGDVAALAEVIDRDTINLRGDQTLTQAIDHVPGLLVSTQLGLFESVLMRGMPRVGNEFTNVLLLVDGIPQTNSGNDARVVALPINDASAIEVVRGPNSALYGRTAIGGAINVRTADPSTEPEVGLEFTTGEFEMARGLLHASGPMRDWGGYYVSIGSERSGGYFVNRIDPDFSAGNAALFGKLTFVPDARSSGSISVNRVVSDNDTPTNEPVVDGRLLHEIDPRFERFTNFNIPGPNYHQEEGRVTFNYQRTLAPWAKLVEVFGFRTVQLKFIEDGDFLGEPYDLDAATVTMYPFSQQADEDIYYQEARLELTPAAGHSAIVGGSYEHNNGRLANEFIDNDPDLGGFTISYLDPVIPPKDEWNYFSGRRTYHLGITGLFGQYMFEPVPRLLVSAAGRYDRLALDVTRSGGPRVEQTFDAFSPKVSATVRLLNGDDTGGLTLNAYGAYAQAFLPPRRPSALIPADVALNLQPEDIENVEGGVKGTAVDGRLFFEAAAFRMTEDGVVLNRRQGPFFAPTNAGKWRYKGMELGGRWNTSRVTAFANAAFYRNRFGDFIVESEDGDIDYTGNRLRLSPDYVVNWGLAGSLYPAVDANFTVKHVSDTQGNEDNTFRLAPYTLVDAAISWWHGPVRLTLSAHNLFNAEYYWNGDGEAADPGRPRQVLLTTAVVLR